MTEIISYQHETYNDTTDASVTQVRIRQNKDRNKKKKTSTTKEMKYTSAVATYN